MQGKWDSSSLKVGCFPHLTVLEPRRQRYASSRDWPRMEPRLGHSSRPWGQDSNSTLMNGRMPMNVSCRMSSSPKRRRDKIHPQLSPAQPPTIITAARAAQSPGKSKWQKKSRAATVFAARVLGVAFVLGASVSPGHDGQCLFRVMSQIPSKSLSLLAPLTCRPR